MMNPTPFRLFLMMFASATHFVSRLDGKEINVKSTQGALNELCERIKSSVERAAPPKFRPVFNEYQIVDVLRAQIENSPADINRAPCRGPLFAEQRTWKMRTRQT
jgi:hypothetical protein